MARQFLLKNHIDMSAEAHVAKDIDGNPQTLNLVMESHVSVQFFFFFKFYLMFAICDKKDFENLLILSRVVIFPPRQLSRAIE